MRMWCNTTVTLTVVRSKYLAWRASSCNVTANILPNLAGEKPNKLNVKK